MSRYITLTVADVAAIKLDLKAAAAGTPVRIVSGSNMRNITVGNGWIGTATYTADGTTMIVYGDITSFDCSGNEANLTALDPSHNTQLTELICSNNQLDSLDISHNTQLTGLNCLSNKLRSLDISHNTLLTWLSCSNNQLTTLDVSNNTQLKSLYCYGNSFSTATLDDIYCALSDRASKPNGVINTLKDTSDPNLNTVLATSAQNAIVKNWKVQYEYGTDIPATTGSYVCSNSGGGNNVNMNRYIILTVKSGELINLRLNAATYDTPVRIVSGSNTQDITVGPNWNGYHTAGDTTMTIYGDLEGFDCKQNGANLTALDLSNNTQLTGVICSSNQLSSLDLSKNTELLILSCKDNKLTSLDISKNTKLKMLYCSGNNFSTQALDDIYCALPVRSASDNAKIVPVESASAPNHATVIATNAQNATAKNWKVRYANNSADITTTGSYDCSTAVAEAAAEQALTLYPNPVTDVLYLSDTAHTIRVYNIYGIEVAHATDTDRVGVSHLPAGIYTVRADGTVAKMVKR